MRNVQNDRKAFVRFPCLVRTHIWWPRKYLNFFNISIFIITRRFGNSYASYNMVHKKIKINIVEYTANVRFFQPAFFYTLK